MHYFQAVEAFFDDRQHFESIRCAALPTAPYWLQIVDACAFHCVSA